MKKNRTLLLDIGIMFLFILGILSFVLSKRQDLFGLDEDIKKEEGNLLGGYQNNFSGNTMDSIANAYISREVEGLILETKMFDTVQVVPYLKLDLTDVMEINHEFYVLSPNEQGYLKDSYTYEEETQAGAVSETIHNYLPNERITKTFVPKGIILPEQSSIAVTMSRENMSGEGQEGEGSVSVPVDPSFYEMISDATGIPEENISINAYERQAPEKRKENKNMETILSSKVFTIVQIGIGILLFLFLALRLGRRGKKEVKKKELKNIPTIENIPVQEKEDSKPKLEPYRNKRLEEYVRKHPEEAAQSLRKWIKEK
ncbi:hypothetical protein D7X25_20635 [bacterium 1XD42-8]|nr:hypothetical protein D7X25_20635 [bacterium 1XD42-8]